MLRIHPPIHMPFKILVNAIPLTNVHTGIARYISALYETIDTLYGSRVSITYFDGKNFCNTPPRGPKHQTRWNGLADIFWKLPPHIACMIREQIQKRREKILSSRIHEFDVYHETGFFPFACASSIPTVFTVHDLSIQRHPQWHPKERVLFTEKYFAHRAQLSNHIITVSHFTKQELLQCYPELASTPITPIHLGASKELFLPTAALPELPERYYLFVGSNDKRKQLDSVIDAVIEKNDLPLLVAGWSGWGNAITLHPNIIPLGYVPDALLPSLYSNAACLIYPSGYEGFGLPVLEAMQCGCPVITTKTASIPEVCGNSVCYIELPVTPQSIVHALQKLTVTQRQKLSESGLQQAQTFSWEQTARQTFTILQECAKSKTQT